MKDKLNKKVDMSQWKDQDVIEVEIESIANEFPYMNDKGTYSRVGPGKHTIRVMKSDLDRILNTKIEPEPELVTASKKNIVNYMKKLDGETEAKNLNPGSLEQEKHDARIVAMIRYNKVWQHDFLQKNDRNAKPLLQCIYLRNLGMAQIKANEHKQDQNTMIELMKQNSELIKALMEQKAGK